MEAGRKASPPDDRRIDGADQMHAAVGLDGALERVLRAVATVDRVAEDPGDDAARSPAVDEARQALHGALVTLTRPPAIGGAGARDGDDPVDPAGEDAMGVVDDVVRRLLVAAVAAHDAAGAAGDRVDEVIAQIDGAIRALRVGALTGAFRAAG